MFYLLSEAGNSVENGIIRVIVGQSFECSQTVPKAHCSALVLETLGTTQHGGIAIGSNIMLLRLVPPHTVQSAQP